MTTEKERRRIRNAERQAKLRAVLASSGMRQFSRMVPSGHFDDLARTVELMVANPHLTVRLVDTRTGRTVSMK